ncbi:terminal uridylyltransferase 4-like [Patiria miniata]|uniref:Terminal uridylyltransferase 4/7 nucleotidyltransferase domain-containing protein n=1 Tax=Patiria miniata TaxID=46514 RepID=A0A913ZYE5_PATMI|nr:terminal uridylyltransferase 4-like [Patiria miniata]XP_038056330.1 terminal uridylyltransferase 4-like [Patiria miniata]
MDHPSPKFPAGQHKKHSKNAKEKIKAREQQRYLRKVQKYDTHLNIDVTQEKDPPDASSHADFVHVRIKDEDAKDVRIKNERAKMQEEHISAIHPDLTQFGSDGTRGKKQNKSEDKEIVLPTSTVMQPNTGYSPSPSVGINDDVLEEHHIFRLKKKSSRFPQAMFYCRLCNYHLDTLALCMKHWKEQRHSTLEKSQSNMKEIESIEAPSKAHAEAVTTLLEATVAEIALKDFDLKRRSLIADTLQLLLHRTMPDVKVNLYGSSLSGFGFRDSDVNLGIEAPEGTLPSQVLVRAFEALVHEDTDFDDVRSDFEERFPCIRFSDKQR